MDADHVLSVLHKGFSAPLVPQGAAHPTPFQSFLSAPRHLFILSEASFASEPPPPSQLFSFHGGSTLDDCFPSNTTDDCQPYINSPGFRLNSQLPITSQNFPVKYIQFPRFQIELTVFLTYFFMIPSLVRNTPSKPSLPSPPAPLLELETDWNTPFPSHLHIPLKSSLPDLFSSTSLSPAGVWSWF